MLARVIDLHEESLETSFDNYCAIKVALQNTSQVIEQLNLVFPLENIRHLKRIQKLKGHEHVTALVCKISREDEILDMEAILKEHFIPFVEILSVNVPTRRPITKKQYESWNSIWPLVFHESMDEKLKLKQLLEHEDLFKQFKEYFTKNNLSAIIIETFRANDKLEFNEEKIIYESPSEKIMCDEPSNNYPFDHFVLNCLSGPLKNKRITRSEKVPYLLSGCVAILSNEPCTMCSMALLHSRIDAVIYFRPNHVAGALGSKCYLHSMISLNHHFPVYNVQNFANQDFYSNMCPCQAQEMSDKSKKLGAANDKPRVFSLRDLQNDGNNDSSDDEKQTFYAGGEKSGTAVQGGGKKNSNNYKEAQEIMGQIFAKASSEDPSKKNKNIFSGSGKKLNGTSSPKSTTGQIIPEPEIVTVDFIIWSDGFTIGEGPLIHFDDPEGLRLLDSLRSGDISAKDLGIGPYELADVKISQLSNEPFSPERRKQVINRADLGKSPEPSKPTFVGNGEKLGADHSETIAVDLAAELEPSISTTRIQVVLPSGSRRVISISARARVSELYSTVKKETNLSTFVLKSGNPAKLIPEELDVFIYQIGLLNASIMLLN